MQDDWQDRFACLWDGSNPGWAWHIRDASDPRSGDGYALVNERTGATWPLTPEERRWLVNEITTRPRIMPMRWEQRGTRATSYMRRLPADPADSLVRYIEYVEGKAHRQVNHDLYHGAFLCSLDIPLSDVPLGEGNGIQQSIDVRQFHAAWEVALLARAKWRAVTYAEFLDDPDFDRLRPIEPTRLEDLTFEDYWDGPLNGTVSFEGVTCWYERFFDHSVGEYLFPRRYLMVDRAEHFGGNEPMAGDEAEIRPSLGARRVIGWTDVDRAPQEAWVTRP
ncbi:MULTISPECIES: hypothetical protein [Deinococcus]|uniref:Uncharacterized protein n=1 Tax=Deinococcus rufus TaxID=2136097 RepID=A0ABV7ZGV1_9DEIO|nr:hypothetical protein [Deinococcus sp. AB2017081]WQE96804.1 hypothetical protein U2P90_07860 [Deinococcus sp. AB2017081]